MYKNYETRVKDFIRDMTNPSNQVVIKDVTEKIDNCRLELMNESKLQKPFVFKGYLSEIDRINDTVRKNRLLFNLPDYPEEKVDKIKNKSLTIDLNPKIDFHIDDQKKSIDEEKEKDKHNDYENNKFRSIELSRKEKISPDNFKKSFKRKLSVAERNQIKDLVKKDSILQPQMRFKARTDLERIYDALNGDYMRRGDREVIERQLKYINLYNYRKPKEILREDAEDYNNDYYQINNISENTNANASHKKGIKNIYKPAHIYYDARINNKKRWARKDNLNIEAKEILNSYHIKTHFKATEEIAEYNSPRKKKLNESCFLLPHLYRNNRYSNSYKSKRFISLNKDEIDYSKMEYTGRLFKFEEEHEKDVLDEEEKSKQCNEKVTINNPILRGNRIRFDPHSMKVLSKIAFRNSLKDDEDNNSANNNINSERNMINREFEKNDDTGETHTHKLNDIAKKVLEECNVYSNKSKYNDSLLKAREGKLMITKGMTIKQFEDKYKLNA
jgi:hypothetical protein